MEPKKTRVGFLKEQFINDYKKAIKKHKLLSLNGTEFRQFVDKLDPKSVNEFVAQVKAAKVKKEQDTEHQDYEGYVDPAFFAFMVSMGYPENSEHGTLPELLFNFFLELDPSPHKEYLNWFLNLYRDLVKQRKPFGNVSDKILDPSLMQDGSYRDMLLGGVENRFFEDMFKVHEALERFNFLKKTATLKENEKDINRFQTYEALLKMLRPYMPGEEGSDAVDTLDHKELAALENQVKFESGVQVPDSVPRAKLMFQNDEWLIVWTVNKAANIVFGKYSTWCTATNTANRSMFDTYDKDGYLWVLIRKGKGSKREIDKDPMNRLQFHFESKQYMDATDKHVQPRIAEWLDKHPDIKEYFKGYIVRHTLPKKIQKYQDQVKYLMDLGYGDELIKIYKEVKPKSIEISSFKMKPEVLAEIGEITSLEYLKLHDVGMDVVPESIKNLKNLKYLCCSGNPKITQFPSWIKELTGLKDLHFMNCDIQNEIDLTGMVNLEIVSFDMNNNLTTFPKGIGDAKHLQRISMGTCDVREVGEEILNCRELFMFDMRENMNLTKVPLAITKLPEITAIAFDDTRISQADVQQMIRHGNGKVHIVHYG